MYNNVIRVVGVQGEATKKQLEYAKQISETLKVEMPEKNRQADIVRLHWTICKEV